jgi:hypothetical protein
VRVKSIATSTGQNDSGLFELNFRDERYLPFEGAGAISTWQIELTQEPRLRQFDYATISDVIMHVKYTAREDAGEFKTNAVKHLTGDVFPGPGAQLRLRRVFDLVHEFPTEWYAFFHPANGAVNALQIKIRKQHFAFLAQDATTIQLEAISLFVRTGKKDAVVAVLNPPLGAPPDGKITLADTADGNAFHVGTKDNLGIALDESQTWSLTLSKGAGPPTSLAESDVRECYLVVEYTLPVA